MGVIHKLKLEVINFILEEKKNNPGLSCRVMEDLIHRKFMIRISKSSINSIIKHQGLSMPVGRRQKNPKQEVPEPPIAIPEQVIPVPPAPEPVIEIPEKEAASPVEKMIEIPGNSECSGTILLKAADYLFGGTNYFSETIERKLNRKESDLPFKTEGLVFLPLLERHFYAGSRIPKGVVSSYLTELQGVESISLDLLRAILSILREVRCIKLNISDGSILYLDGQLHTVWSTPHIPYDFCSTLPSIKGYISRYFLKKEPFVFFMTPGYDSPTRDFFNFIISLQGEDRKITQLVLYDNKLEELESIPINQTEKQFFVFGMWPWQFTQHRKIKKIGEFKPLKIELMEKEVYLAEIEIELSQPNVYQSLTFKGYAIKANPTEKTRLIVLSNVTDRDKFTPMDCLKLYFGHWPDFEEAFRDYSRKIELFTYTGGSQQGFLSAQILQLKQNVSLDVKTIFNKYLEVLDLIVKRHFLPLGFENNDFSTMKEHFYSLKAEAKKEKEMLFIKFNPPQDFKFLKELKYACNRINEREIIIPPNLRLWFLATSA